MGRERIARFDGIHRRFALGPQAENDAGRDRGFVVAVRGGDGERAERQTFQPREVVFRNLARSMRKSFSVRSAMETPLEGLLGQ